MTTDRSQVQAPDHSGPVLFLLGLVMAGFLVVVWGLGRPDEEPAPPVEPPPFQQDRGRDGERGPRDERGPTGGQQSAAGRPGAWDRNIP